MPTETIGTVNNRNIVGMLKGALENGSITQDDYDELMQLFFPGPKLVQGDLFDEKAEGGMANINEMTGPIGMSGGGDAFEKYLGGKETGGGFTSSLKNAMKSHPFQTSIFLEMGFDKMFDLLSMLPMMKDGGIVGYDNGGSVKEEHKTADIFGLHPLVVFQEMHDAYILDGGTLTFKEFFDAMQDQLNMEDLNEVPPVKEIG